MGESKTLTMLVFAITIALWILVLQNAGIIEPLNRAEVVVANTVDVWGSVDVSGTVEVDNTVDVNLAEVVGSRLVKSKRGMYIGVSSTKNTVIPIHWGEVSIDG